MNYRTSAAVLSLIVLGAFLYAPSVRFDFVNWDDPAYILFNDSIRGWTPANLYAVATETVTRNYAPLTILSFLFDHTFSGMNPAGYHLTNLVLHILNGILALILIRQLTGSLFVAWLTAALFVSHPIQIETVAWISSRKGLLSAAFILSALIVRLRPEAQLKHDGWYLTLLLAALLSKALAVVVPPLVLLYDVLIRREKISDAVVRQIIPGLMSLLLLLHTMGAQTSILGGVRGHMNLSLPHILAVDVTILWRYVGMLLWPTGLSVLYDPPTTGIGFQVITGLAGLVALVVAAWRCRLESPLYLFSLAVFLLLLFPVLNFFRITTLMNDRYLYLPCLCVFAPLAALLCRAADETAGRLRRSADTVSGLLRSAAAFSVVCGCLIMSSRHLPVWTNSETLWTYTLKQVPQLAVVRIQWALTLYDQGRVADAIDVLKRAQLECITDEADQERIVSQIAAWTSELSRVASVLPEH